MNKKIKKDVNYNNKMASLAFYTSFMTVNIVDDFT